MGRLRSRFAFGLLLSLCFAAPTHAQAPDLAGEWSGVIDQPGQPLEVVVTLRRADGTWQGAIDIKAQGAKALPLGKFAVEGRRAAFAIEGIPGEPTFRGELSEDGTSFAGTFTQGGASLPFALHAAGQLSLDGVQAFVDDLREKMHVPGCAVAVVKGGDVVTTLVSGLRDVDQKAPVTQDTLFAIGSSTKAFTTMLLAMLADEGAIDWDQPVRTWIPEFALADPVVSERLTPRDLVTHRSGMPRHDLVWYGADFERGDLVRRLRYLPLNKDLRVEFQYNNLMLLTAGYLAERVTGSTWEALVQKRIFAPLGMGRSNFKVADSAADPDHAEPYRYQDGATARIPFRDITAIGPAGSINSCARDMAQWVALHLSGGRHGAAQLVAQSALDDLHAPRMVMAGRGSPNADLVPVGYALGWMVDVYRGARRIHHGGNIDGFSALVSFLPDAGYGFVVLCNLDGTGFPELVVRRLCDRALKLADKDWASEALRRTATAEAEGEQGKKNEAAERVGGTTPSHPLEAYAGAYWHPGYGACTVQKEGDRLRIDFHGLSAPLEHWHYDVFRCGKAADLPDVEGTRVQFTTDLDGDVDGLRAGVEPAVDPIAFARQPDAQLRDPVFLARLAGTYQLNRQLATFAVQGDKLTVALPGQFYVLEPKRALVFAIPELKGYSVRFVLDVTGNPTAVRFRQPEGVFEGKRTSS